MECQTDAFLDRPPTPFFVPAKTGRDVATQIEEGEVWSKVISTSSGKVYFLFQTNLRQNQKGTSRRTCKRNHAKLRNKRRFRCFQLRTTILRNVFLCGNSIQPERGWKHRREQQQGPGECSASPEQCLKWLQQIMWCLTPAHSSLRPQQHSCFPP